MLKFLPFHLFRCEGAYQKLDAISKGHTIRQVLSGSVFLNFHHLHPEFQKFILLRIQTHYCSKKDIQSDVTFFMVMSVSVLSNPIHTAGLICNLLSLPVFFFFFQQLLSSTLSVFWGVGIGCLIEYFENDIEKLVHAFYPLFKKWVQLDYHNLKKLSDLSISIRRYTFRLFF